MSQGEVMLKVSNLTKMYEDFLAVDGASFDVKQGEIFGFLGPNGAGKSSTINMMTGLSRITSGTYEILGEDFHQHQKKYKQVIGVVPDESNMYDELTGFENLCFSAALYGIERFKREKRAKALLEKFQLTEAGDKLFRVYSKGMKRKLTIAAALIHDPHILFLDEPTTGIDVKSAREIRNLIKDLNGEGKTIFLTTHYLEEAERLCSRIAFIVQGRIVKIGHIGELVHQGIRGYMTEFILDQGSLNPNVIEEQLKTHFPGVDITLEGDHVIVIESPEPVMVNPYIKFFDDLGIQVQEAKSRNLSLEEVFVRITGIESPGDGPGLKGVEAQ